MTTPAEHPGPLTVEAAIERMKSVRQGWARARVLTNGYNNDSASHILTADMQALDVMLAALGALEEDKKRLDFLQERKAYINHVVWSSDENEGFVVEASDETPEPNQNLRLAIDAAMAAHTAIDAALNSGGKS